jgi:hypothetical protein
MVNLQCTWPTPSSKTTQHKKKITASSSNQTKPASPKPTASHSISPRKHLENLKKHFHKDQNSTWRPIHPPRGNTATNHKGKKQHKTHLKRPQKTNVKPSTDTHTGNRTAARHPANSKKHHRSSKDHKLQLTNNNMAARDHTSLSEGPRILADNPRAKTRPRPPVHQKSKDRPKGPPIPAQNTALSPTRHCIM